MKLSFSEERILTLHPQEGKKGKRIPLSRYTLMHDTMIAIIGGQNEISYKELSILVQDKLTGVLDGSIPWLMETVMLDLLARHMIQKISTNPLKLSLLGN